METVFYFGNIKITATCTTTEIKGKQINVAMLGNNKNEECEVIVYEDDADLEEQVIGYWQDIKDIAPAFA